MKITKEYQQEQRRLHEEREDYGIASLQYVGIVDQFVRQLDLKSLLDYGCGKGRLGDNMTSQIAIWDYDPAIPGKDKRPSGKFDMVTCLDVLEHIEPECLDEVLDDLADYVGMFGLFSIHTGPAVKVLSDGRNAHLIQEKAAWWMPKLCKRFDVQKMNSTKNGFWVLVRPLT